MRPSDVFEIESLYKFGSKLHRSRYFTHKGIAPQYSIFVAKTGMPLFIPFEFALGRGIVGEGEKRKGGLQKCAIGSKIARANLRRKGGASAIIVVR